MWVRVYNMNTGNLCRKFKIDGLVCDQITRVREQYGLPHEPTFYGNGFRQYETKDYFMEVEL